MNLVLPKSQRLCQLYSPVSGVPVTFLHFSYDEGNKQSKYLCSADKQNAAFKAVSLRGRHNVKEKVTYLKSFTVVMGSRSVAKAKSV